MKLAKKNVSDDDADGTVDWELYSPDSATTTSILAAASTASKKALNQLAKRHGSNILNLGITAKLGTTQPVLQQEAGGDVEVTYFLSTASASKSQSIQPSAYSTLSLVMTPSGTTFTQVGYSVTLVDLSTPDDVTVYEYLSTESGYGEQSSVADSDVLRAAFDGSEPGCLQDLAVESAVNDASGSFGSGTDTLIAQATDSVFDGFGENACALNSTTDSGGEISLLTSTPDDTFTVGGQAHFSVTVQNTGGEDATGVELSDALPGVLANVTSSCSARGGAKCPGDLTFPTDQVLDIPVGGAVDFSIVGTVSSASEGLTNDATVTLPDSFACGTGVVDAQNDCTSSTTLTAVTIPGEVFVGMKPVDQSPAFGASDSFIVEVKNVGTVPVSEFTLSDPTPADWDPSAAVSWTCAPQDSATCPASSGQGSITGLRVLALPVGGIVDFTISGQVAVNASNTVTNVATVSVPESVFCEDETGYDRTVTDATSGDRSCSVQSTVPVSPTIELGAYVTSVSPLSKTYLEELYILDLDSNQDQFLKVGPQYPTVGPDPAVDGQTYTIREEDYTGQYSVTADCVDDNNGSKPVDVTGLTDQSFPSIHENVWLFNVTVQAEGPNVAKIRCEFVNTANDAPPVQNALIDKPEIQKWLAPRRGR